MESRLVGSLRDRAQYDDLQNDVFKCVVRSADNRPKVGALKCTLPRYGHPEPQAELNPDLSVACAISRSMVVY